MLVCDLVGAALAQRRCPFIQELFCAATLVCMDVGLCVLPEVLDFIVISMSCMMMPDRVLMLLGFFVVLTDFEMVMASVRMIFDFFAVPMDIEKGMESLCMFFDFSVVPVDFEMVQDGAAAASNLIECKIHSSRSISHFSSMKKERKEKKEKRKNRRRRMRKESEGSRPLLWLVFWFRVWMADTCPLKVITGSRVSALCVDLAIAE